MKAARWHGVKDIRVEDIPEPKPGKGEVKVKVAWTGICGSDLHEYLAGPIFVPVDEDHPLSHDKAPITMGHEYCGTVAELGEGVTDIAVGDRVAIEPIFACGECAACLEGKYNLCDGLGFVGLSGGHGGFATYSVVPARMVHKMPEALSMEQGALVEPAAVALHAVRLSKIKAGDKAAVFGAGPIGLLVVESLRVAGASEIHVVEPSEVRRKPGSSPDRVAAGQQVRRLGALGLRNGPGLPLTAKRDCLRRNAEPLTRGTRRGHFPGHFATRAASRSQRGKDRIEMAGVVVSGYPVSAKFPANRYFYRENSRFWCKSCSPHFNFRNFSVAWVRFPYFH